MPAKRYSVEQIVAKLREAEKLQAQGQTVAQVCKRLGIVLLQGAVADTPAEEGLVGLRRAFSASSAFRRWEADRRRAGARHLAAQGPRAGKMVSPARRRAAVAYLLRRHKVSERRACRLVSQHGSTQR
jgi:hypothetical protein